jgi:putative flippase GtrA
VPTVLKPFIAGVISWIIGGLVAYLASKGISVDKDSQQQIIEYTVGLVIPLGGVVAAITHKIVAKYTNPGDAATTQLVEEHHIENEQLKAAGSNSPSVIR